MENHKRLPWHATKPEVIYKALHISEEGLSDAEVAERLARSGRNELRQKPKKTIWQTIRGQTTDPMVLILIGAAVFSTVLLEWTEAIVILTIVIINAVIGTVQEKKVESSLETLERMSAPDARVLRWREESIASASELVVGDIVLIDDGTVVPTDLRLIESASLKIQEASFTRESVPSERGAKEIMPQECVLGDWANMAYTSSIVTYGHGASVVAATGMSTEAGNTAGLLENQDELDTPLKRKLNTVGKTLTVTGIIVCALIFAIGAFYGRPLIPQFLVVIFLAISIIPEGPPVTVTTVMALGVQKMAKQNALTQKLPAVETLGSATIICSDKIGTLTLSQMAVTQIVVNGDFEAGIMTVVECADKEHPDVYRKLVYVGALCNNASLDPDHKGEIIGGPTEGALVFLVQKSGIDHEELEETYPRLFEQPFDSERERMLTVYEISQRLVSYTRGAVDEILPLCMGMLTSWGVRPITQTDTRQIQDMCDSMS